MQVPPDAPQVCKVLPYGLQPAGLRISFHQTKVSKSVFHSGIIGGNSGYRLLRRVNVTVAADRAPCDGDSYRGISRPEVLFGGNVPNRVRGCQVPDSGCGTGGLGIRGAQGGAIHVVSPDIRQRVLDTAARGAKAAGVFDPCSITTQNQAPKDLTFPVYWFKHYVAPSKALHLLAISIPSVGKFLNVFGPPWLSYGGHLFSDFPSAHLILTGRSLTAPAE